MIGQKKILLKIASDLSVDAIFPFEGPPFIPILTWAQRAEPIHPYPFGAFVHPVYGLWHFFRGVLLFKNKITLPQLGDTASPCKVCDDQPCQTTCPVGAIESSNFSAKACVKFLDPREGKVCLKSGRLARLACPIGKNYTYEPSQANFHLTAFLQNFTPN